MQKDVLSLGATVRFEDLELGDTKTYQIVGEDEADIKAGKVSIVSPYRPCADWQRRR